MHCIPKATFLLLIEPSGSSNGVCRVLAGTLCPALALTPATWTFSSFNLFFLVPRCWLQSHLLAPVQEQCRNPAVRAAALCSLLQAAPRQQLCPEVLCSSQNRAFKVSKWCRSVITRVSLWALRKTCFHNRWDKAYCHLQDWLCCGAGDPQGLGWDVGGKLGIPISRIKACAPLEDLMAFDLSGGVSCHWVPFEKQELTQFYL